MVKDERTKVVFVISGVNYALAFDWTQQYLDHSKYQLFFIFLNESSPDLHHQFVASKVNSYFISLKGKKGYPSAALKLFLLFLRIKPNVVHAHLFDANLIAMPIAFLLRIKNRIYTRHHSTYHFDYHPHMVKYDRLINFFSTKIVAISQNVYQVLVDREGVNPAKVVVINHGFKLEDFSGINEDKVNSLVSKYNPNEKFPIVGVIARWTEWKGVQYIVLAFKQLLNDYPNALLLLANAKGDYSSQISTMLADLPDDSYCAIPFEKDLASLYHMMDVYVHVPIDDHAEAFGQTYVEALAAGVPSVFTLSGIACEFVENLSNACVVPYKDSHAIVKSISLLLGNDKLKNELVTNGKSAVKQKFDLKTMINSLNLLYEA